MDQENEISLGDYLKNAREKANFSIEKLALKTRINENVLKNLENENFKKLPSAAYLKGFVLHYAKIFSLAEDETVKKLEMAYLLKTGEVFPSLNHTKKILSNKERDTKKEISAPDEIINNSENIIDTTKSLAPYFIGAGVILVSFLGYKLISNTINNETISKNEATSPATSIKTETVIEKEATTPTLEVAAPSEVIEEKVDKPEAVVPVEKVVEEKTVDKKEVVATSKETVRNFPHVDFKSIPMPIYKTLTDAPENNDDTLMPKSYKAKMDENLQNLYIHADRGETWVSYKVDENDIQSEFIRQGKALFLQGEVIRMFFGNINATKIFLNNTLVDGLSKSGVKTIIFPENKAKNFKRPLFPKSAKGAVFTAEEYEVKMKEESEKIGNP